MNNLENSFSKLVMIVLAMFPILNYYQGPVLSYGEWTFILLICYRIIKTGKIIQFIFIKEYVIYWIYLATILVFVSSSFKITYLIPGGLKFFIWSLILGFTVKYFNLQYFLRIAKYIVIANLMVILLQEFQYFFTGTRFLAFLPLSQNLTIGINYSELSLKVVDSERSYGFFSEPAHVAQYVLPLLAVELFSKENSYKLYTKYSLIIIFLIFLIRSGNGFVGLLLVFILKIIHYNKRVGLRKKVLLFLLLFPVFIGAINFYTGTKSGGEVFNRIEEFENDESSRSYVRIYRGYTIYDQLPTIHKVVGIHSDDLFELPIPLLHFYDNRTQNGYFNGIQMVLIYSGIIGVFFITYMFIAICRHNNYLAVVLSLLLLLLSLLGQMYLSYTMLYCMSIALYLKKRKNEI